LAGEITRQWYERYHAERVAIERESAAHERLEDAADAADAAADAAADDRPGERK
jgi:hypothetical protein